MAKKTEKEDDTILRRYTRFLACPLNDDELIEHGKRLAETLADIRGEQTRHDMLKAEMKSSMASLEAKRDQLSLEVSRAEVMREIEVEEIADFAANKAFQFRQDTGQQIAERKLTPEERQTVIPGTGAPIGAH